LLPSLVPCAVFFFLLFFFFFSSSVDPLPLLARLPKPSSMTPPPSGGSGLSLLHALHRSLRAEFRVWHNGQGQLPGAGRLRALRLASEVGLCVGGVGVGGFVCAEDNFCGPPFPPFGLSSADIISLLLPPSMVRLFRSSVRVALLLPSFTVAWCSVLVHVAVVERSLGGLGAPEPTSRTVPGLAAPHTLHSVLRAELSVSQWSSGQLQLPGAGRRLLFLDDRAWSF